VNTKAHIAAICNRKNKNPHQRRRTTYSIAGSARFALIKPIFKKRALPSWRFQGLDTIARREKEMHIPRAARRLFVNTFIWLRTPAAAAVNILPKKAIKEQF